MVLGPIDVTTEVVIRENIAATEATSGMAISATVGIDNQSKQGFTAMICILGTGAGTADGMIEDSRCYIGLGSVGDLPNS